MKLVDSDRGDTRSLSPPHERVLARALGLQADDGLIPWAAWQHLQAGGQPGDKAWAFITPCHWAMGRQQASLSDPAALDLQESESRELLAAMQPYFATHGISLHYLAPARWLAEGELFRSLPSASLDRVMGRNVDAWLPGAGIGDAKRLGAGPPQAETAHPGGSEVREATSVGARKMRLLQNEMQMLLYTHSVNDARAAQGQLAVNSIWISGSGALQELESDSNYLSELTVLHSLTRAAFSTDWAVYAQAWAALDNGEGARLLARQQAGETLRLSLCGERNALTFESSRPGLMTRINHLFGPRPLLVVLEQL